MEEMSQPVGSQARTVKAVLVSLAETIGTPMFVLAVTLGCWLCVDGLWHDLIPLR
jgi:hypothetical protein